jgi:alkylated DNA repair dioxygenase AlkB
MLGPPPLPPGYALTLGFVPEADALLDTLLTETPWERHVIKLYGKTLPMPRRIAWFGERPYGYSGLVHPAAPWPPALAALLPKLRAACCQPFNGALLNRYDSGQDSMGWHTDDDHAPPALGGLASLSLGATRRLLVRPRGGGPSTPIDLPHGSLLWMSAESQRLTQHALPKTPRPVGVRVNVTWRWVGEG